MKKEALSILPGLFLLVTFSCRDISLSSEGGSDEEQNGSLLISFTMVNRISLILPDIDMTISGYIITGEGPGGASFRVETTGESVLVEKLDFGSWTVIVEAENTDEIIIGRGSGSTVVQTGETSTCDITVTPIEGYGTLDITVMWNAEDTENPFIDSELIPYSGSSQALDFTVTGGNTATFHSDTVESGYHTLTVKLLDNGILTMGAVEIVRIVNDTLSQGTFEFYEINSTVGYIAVNIFPEMAEPLEVLISGQADKIEYGESMTVTASVLNDPGNTVYVWYINGESVGTGASLTVGNSLAAGVYRLDVTAFTADGKRGGSTTCMFHVMGIAPPIEWQKCLGGSEDDWADSIQQTSNNGYIIAGRTYSNNGDVPGNHGSIDLWVIKLK